MSTWEAPVRCMLCGFEHRAVAPEVPWAEGRPPVDCPDCGAVRSCMEVNIAYEESMAMTDAELEAELRASGRDPEQVSAEAHAMIHRLLDEHATRSKLAGIPSFELEQADGQIAKLWQLIFGDETMPARARALQRIYEMCEHVRWPRPRKRPRSTAS